MRSRVLNCRPCADVLALAFFGLAALVGPIMLSADSIAGVGCGGIGILLLLRVGMLVLRGGAIHCGPKSGVTRTLKREVVWLGTVRLRRNQALKIWLRSPDVWWPTIPVVLRAVRLSDDEHAPDETQVTMNLHPPMWLRNKASASGYEVVELGPGDYRLGVEPVSPPASEIALRATWVPTLTLCGHPG